MTRMRWWGAALAMGCSTAVPASDDAGRRLPKEDVVTIINTDAPKDTGPRCSSPSTECAETCVNTASNNNHCGACGNACTEGQTCVGGACMDPMACPTGQTLCSGACVDTNADAMNCGGCGRTCAAGQACMSGSCMAGAMCSAGQTVCAGTCVDLTTAIGACGACDRPCRGAPDRSSVTCSGGRCVSTCNTGWADCDGDGVCEADTLHGQESCGRCGRACAADDRCLTGQCVQALPRPVRPLSAEAVALGPRLFGWIADPGSEATRFELCSSRTCDRVLEGTTVRGTRHVSQALLSAGVYFWRVRAVRAGRVDPRPAVVWPLIVSTDREVLRRRIVADIDGDAREDTIDQRQIPQRNVPAGFSFYGQRPSIIRMSPLGDRDGDGFGDLEIVDFGLSDIIEARRYQSWVWFSSVAFGGPAGLFRTYGEDHDVIRRHFGSEYQPNVVLLAVDDFDGDGRTDAIIGYTFGTYVLNSFVRSGPANARLRLGASLWRLVLSVAGDINDDLGVELAGEYETSMLGEVSTGRTVYSLADGTLREVDVPRCEALGAAMRRGPGGFYTDLRAVPNASRPELVDLVGTAIGMDGSSIVVRWFAGSGGLRGDRCVAEP